MLYLQRFFVWIMWQWRYCYKLPTFIVAVAMLLVQIAQRSNKPNKLGQYQSFGCVEQLAERRSSAGVLLLCYARLTAKEWPFMWVNRPLTVWKESQLSLSSFRVDKFSSEQLFGCALVALSGECSRSRLSQVRFINRWAPFVACRLPLNPSVYSPALRGGCCVSRPAWWVLVVSDCALCRQSNKRRLLLLLLLL